MKNNGANIINNINNNNNNIKASMKIINENISE
jgi:hypothetical protein